MHRLGRVGAFYCQQSRKIKDPRRKCEKFRDVGYADASSERPAAVITAAKSLRVYLRETAILWEAAASFAIYSVSLLNNSR